MSFKLYNAYIYQGRPLVGVADIFALSLRIRDSMRPFSRCRFFRTYSRAIAEVVDRAWLGASTVAADKRAADVVYERLDVARKEMASGVRSPTWDVGAEWIFFQAGARLLLYFEAENAIREAFERRFTEFADYHYQDSSRPEGIAADDWKQRRRDWEAIGRGGSLFENGLAMRLWGVRTEPQPFDLDVCLKKLPSCGARATRIARELEMERWVSRRVPCVQSAPHRVMSAIREWQNRSNTAPARRRMKHLIARCRRVLPPVITREIALSTIETLRRLGRARAKHCWQ